MGTPRIRRPRRIYRPKPREHRERQARRRRAFTLIELVLVVAILGVLSAIAMPRIAGAAQSARPAAFARSLDTLADAILLYYYEHGEWPGDGSTGKPPTELEGRVDQNAWTAGTPLGGEWDSEKDYDNIYGIGVHGDADPALLLEVDRLIDNGDLATGSFRQFASDRWYLVLGPN